MLILVQRPRRSRRSRTPQQVEQRRKRRRKKSAAKISALQNQLENKPETHNQQPKIFLGMSHRLCYCHSLRYRKAGTMSTSASISVCASGSHSTSTLFGNSKD